jgi:hypothetical protein
MMSTPTTVSAVQESTKCIEGVHMTHIQHARLVCVEVVLFYIYLRPPQKFLRRRFMNLVLLCERQGLEKAL